MVHEIRRLTAMGAVGGQWEILSNQDTFAIGPCVFKFDLENVPDSPVQPVPNVLRVKPTEAGAEQAGKAPLTRLADAASALRPEDQVEPMPDIFRERSDSTRQEPDTPPEPPMEQAAS
jgi:hypothetical protein